MPPLNPSEPKYLLMKELAARWRTDIRTLERRRWMGTEPVPSVKIGGKVLFRLEDIEEFEASQRKEPR